MLCYCCCLLSTLQHASHRGSARGAHAIIDRTRTQTTMIYLLPTRHAHVIFRGHIIINENFASTRPCSPRPRNRLPLIGMPTGTCTTASSVTTRCTVKKHRAYRSCTYARLAKSPYSSARAKRTQFICCSAATIHPCCIRGGTQNQKRVFASISLVPFTVVNNLLPH